MGNREFSASLIQQKIKITQYKFFLKKEVLWELIQYQTLETGVGIKAGMSY